MKQRRRKPIDEELIRNIQVCGLQCLDLIYKSTQGLKENGKGLRTRWKRWNQNELTKDSLHKWTTCLSAIQILFQVKPSSNSPSYFLSLKNRRVSPPKTTRESLFN